MNWFEISNPERVPSPALLVFEERVDENLRRMVAMAGGASRLRPHIKTHKLAELVQRQMDLGIARFKAATIAEAELVATVRPADVLIAYQPVGPQVDRLFTLQERFPESRFSVLVDDAGVVEQLHAEATRRRQRIAVWMDLDVGQHRTGIAPGPAAFELGRMIAARSGLELAGLHAYDGHLHDSDPAVRKAGCDAAFSPVERLATRLRSSGIEVPSVVAGGTPTFPVHASRPEVECSPGTCVLWDAGYSRKLPDLDFLPAAVLLTRVVSKPASDRLCLDLGYKAISAEMTPPRVIFLNLKESVPVAHNEEHLVLETPAAGEFRIGDVLYGIPWHICPTVALHQEVWPVRDGVAGTPWLVRARARRLTV